jgi:DNA replication protein DnaC
MSMAYSRFLLRKNGLGRLADKCTLDRFETVRGYSRDMKENAIDYLEHGQDKSFFIAGQSGSGKTHICTAICCELIEQGKSFRFFDWVQVSTKLKGQVLAPADYEREIEQYKKADILYIDDFLKQSVTEADMRLAYEIINSRYVSGKPTIISSERDLTEIRHIRGEDSGKAIARRIYEMCGEGTYCHKLVKEDKRLRFVVD